MEEAEEGTWHRSRVSLSPVLTGVSGPVNMPLHGLGLYFLYLSRRLTTKPRKQSKICSIG